jgi:hypothetical protein
MKELHAEKADTTAQDKALPDEWPRAQPSGKAFNMHDEGSHIATNMLPGRKAACPNIEC